MGWTTQYRAKGISNVDFFSELLGEGRSIVEHATVNRVFYAAVKDLDTGRVWGYVALTQWNRTMFNFGWKDMSETMGLGDVDAPLKVLDALSPTDNEYALEWRKECRANADRKARQAAALKELADGDVVTLVRPLRFTDGATRQAFTVRAFRDRAGRRQVRLTADGYGYQVPNWRNLVASVSRGGDTVAVIERKVPA